MPSAEKAQDTYQNVDSRAWVVVTEPDCEAAIVHLREIGYRCTPAVADPAFTRLKPRLFRDTIEKSLEGSPSFTARTARRALATFTTPSASATTPASPFSIGIGFGWRLPNFFFFGRYD